jgi:putative transposase
VGVTAHGRRSSVKFAAMPDPDSPHSIADLQGAVQPRNPRVGEPVASALRFWDGKRYRLVAWCVMPNHVHVVCRLFAGEELATVLHGWKSYTAQRANAILGRKGAFCEREYL